jgi:dihydroneopterin aldolase/2-amino-4-hydroxy-6-hydroxymethyldihydropteridine diphosphokinase
MPVAVAPLPPGSEPAASDLSVLNLQPSTLVEVVIAVGGNLGPVQETLRWAVHRLNAMPGFEITGVGPLAQSAPVGVSGQPDYLNTVVVGRTLLSPRELLNRLQAIEIDGGRERNEQWGPRTLDLDVIVYGDLIVTTPELTLPHPRAHERAFVLQPWAAIDPAAVLPGPHGGQVAVLGAAAPDAYGLRWMPPDWLSDGSGRSGAA